MLLPKVEVKKILYTTDLSDDARNAFAYAVSLANRYDAGLTILHVIAEDPDLDTRVIGYISASQWEQIKEKNFDEARQALIGKQRPGRAIREVLGRFCEDVQSEMADVTFQTDEIVIERGEPVEKILEVAKDRNCDLIVMGSRGYGTFKDAVMGGTARRVLRHAKIPVLLVRLEEE